MQKAVDAAQINERTVVGDVLDDTLDNGAFGERFKELGAFFAHARFHNGAAGDNNVVALTVKLDDLEFEGLAFVRGRILHRTRIDQGARQERADAVGHDGEAALHLPGDGAGDEFAGFQSLFEVHPGRKALSLVAGEDRIAVAVFNRFNCHGNEVAGLHGHFTAVILEFFDGHISFRLKAGVHDNVVVVNADNFSGDDFALAHFLLGKALFKELGKRFGIGIVGHVVKSLMISPVRESEMSDRWGGVALNFPKSPRRPLRLKNGSLPGKLPPPRHDLIHGLFNREIRAV